MSEYEVDWGLSKLHDCLLCMLKDLCILCETNNISFSLAYGSVLGAVRHNGFIPWDDDVDIYMDLESYKKFKNVYKSNYLFNQKYYLQEYDCINEFVELPKIRMNGTTYIESAYKNKDMHQGIYIDIFILHNAPKNYFQRKKQFIWNQYLTIKGLSNKNYKDSKKFNWILSLLRIFPYNFLREKSFKEIYKYDDKNCQAFFDVDVRKFENSFYNKDLIFPTKKVKFCNIELPIPNKSEEYLKKLYGNFMKLPPLEDIKKNQHSEYWSDSEDYKNHCTNIINFEDERKGLCRK